MNDENDSLYTSLQKAGFIVMFKKQTEEMTSHKK
jgi:hypothetical protein